MAYCTLSKMLSCSLAGSVKEGADGVRTHDSQCTRLASTKPQLGPLLVHHTVAPYVIQTLIPIRSAVHTASTAVLSQNTRSCITVCSHGNARYRCNMRKSPAYLGCSAAWYTKWHLLAVASATSSNLGANEGQISFVTSPQSTEILSNIHAVKDVNEDAISRASVASCERSNFISISLFNYTHVLHFSHVPCQCAGPTSMYSAVCK